MYSGRFSTLNDGEDQESEDTTDEEEEGEAGEGVDDDQHTWRDRGLAAGARVGACHLCPSAGFGGGGGAAAGQEHGTNAGGDIQRRREIDGA